MSAQPVPHGATRTSEDVLDAAIGAARAGGRVDIADRLTATRRLLGNAAVTVQVAGGAQQDRTALVTGLLRAARGRVAFIDADSGHAAGTRPGDALGMAVDAVVLVASAAQVIGAAELDQARALRHRSPRILLALTGVDRHPSWPEVLEADLERMRAAGVLAAPFAVSVEAHHRAVAAGDPALAAASGIPALAQRLDAIGDEAALGIARTVAHDVLNALAELESTTALAPLPTAPALTTATRPTGTPPERTAPDRTRWQQVLGDGVAAASSDVDFDLRTRVRAAVADAERVLEEGDPARNWEAIERWVRDRLTYEGTQTLALLAEHTAQIAAALEQELGGPLRPLAPAEIPDLLGRQPPRDAPTWRRRSLAARSRSLVMSGYGGLMMALILPRLAGVVLPLWVVVAGAVGAALLMGGAAVSGERKRQLEARRTRAKSLVRHCADGFLLEAGKYVRDTLRRAQQQLRDECAARAASLRRGDRPARTHPPGAPVEGVSGAAAAPAPAPPPELADLRRHALGLLGRAAGAA